MVDESLGKLALTDVGDGLVLEIEPGALQAFVRDIEARVEVMKQKCRSWQ